MPSVMNPRTRSGELRCALFAFMIANMIVFAAYAQAPLPGAAPQVPAGSPPGMQPPLPGAVPQGPAGSPPGMQPPPPGAVPQGPAGSPLGAQPPLPGAVPQGATGSPPGVEQIMTAIDAAESLNRGVSNAEIATLLSSQKGFDRASALKKGQTDEQIIKYLITKTGTLRPAAGANMSKQHENEGDKLYRESHYGKAAKEYTLAIEYSGENPELYKLRADVYKQYLKTDLIAAAKSDPGKAKRDLSDQSKALLCHAIQFDYTRADDLNQKALAAIIRDTYLAIIKYAYFAPITNEEQDIKVTPYPIKSAQKSHELRRLRYMYETKRAEKDAIQADANIKAAIQDYELVCKTKSKQVH
jgi:hypothetical protein